MLESFTYLRDKQSIMVPLFKEIGGGIFIPANILLLLTVLTAIVYVPGSPFMYRNMINMKKKAYEPQKEKVN